MNQDILFKIQIEEFRKFTIFYPASWRAKNEIAFISILIEDLRNRGQQAPTFIDKFGIVLGGIRERFFSYERVPIHVNLSLLLALLYSLFYCFVIAWSPSSATPSSVGPFANASIVTACLIAVSWVLALANCGSQSRNFSFLALTSNLIIGVSAQIFDWFGPSLGAAGIFGILILASILRTARQTKS